ncbi:MAG: response regulator transcription factor [Planctomycetales bacterium]|nr:response regulator transcription factor [Planctomycetales bacterium]
MGIRLVVADDHEVVRSGLASLLRGTGIEIVAEAENGDEAVSAAVQHAPDVLLLDIRMDTTDGLDALEQVREKRPDQRVVMISTYDNPTYVARSAALGADDFVLKGSTREDLLSAIQRAASGQGPIEGSLMARVKGTMARRRDRDDDTPLTNRELQVLRHVALGLSNREIGRSLGISIETVKEHVQNVLRKIDVGDRTQAAVWAVRRKLV